MVLDDAAAIDLLLDEARQAREGRDRWRRVGPILRELKDRGVSYTAIRQATGIPPATVGAIVDRWRTSDSGASTETTRP